MFPIAPPCGDINILQLDKESRNLLDKPSGLINRLKIKLFSFENIDKNLILEFSGESWIELYVENELVEAQIFSNGDIYERQIEIPFKIIVGNADFVKGSYNNTEIDFLTNANRLTGVNTINF